MSENVSEIQPMFVLVIAIIAVCLAVFGISRGVMKFNYDDDKLDAIARIYLYQKYSIALDDTQKLTSNENDLYSVVGADGIVKCSIKYDEEVSKIREDNYCAYKFDKEIQEYLARRIGLPCKIIFDSKGYYTSPREQYSRYIEYLTDCEAADIFVYKTEGNLSECRASIVHDRLREIGLQGALNLYVDTVSQDVLDSIDVSSDAQRTDIKDLAEIVDQRMYNDEE